MKQLKVTTTASSIVTLDGLDITYNSRTRNPAEFTLTRRLEIEQMYKFTKEIEKNYAL